MLTCPNAEFVLCVTMVIAAGQGIIRAHFGRDTCKESDAIAQGQQFILEHRREASAPDPHLLTSLLLGGGEISTLQKSKFQSCCELMITMCFGLDQFKHLGFK